jgi:hypothetical protein
MYTNPQISGERQRDMLARADQQRLVRRFRSKSAAGRRAETPERHLGRARRMMARLRTAMFARK